MIEVICPTLACIDVHAFIDPHPGPGQEAVCLLAGCNKVLIWQSVADEGRLPEALEVAFNLAVAELAGTPHSV